MEKYQYKILYGRPNHLTFYGGKDTLEEDLNNYAAQGYEVLSTHFSTNMNPTAMIILRKKSY